MDKKINKDKISKEELSKFIKDDITKGFGTMREYYINEKGNLVEKHKTVLDKT